MNNKLEKIPKIIHYCWFGKGHKPKIVEKCISSWKDKFIGYEIIEWNENNFDINCNDYVKQAYEAKKFAFVSDYVRVFVLYNYGGIYLDTDVEVFKSLGKFLIHDSFWGFEEKNYIATSTIGAAKGNSLIKMFLDSYSGKTFLLPDGNYNELTNVAIVTDILKNNGLILNGEYQELDGLATFYPRTYFSPYDYINCRNFITNDSYTIHYFYKSWLPLSTRVKTYIKKIVAAAIGGDKIAKLRKLFVR